LLLNQAEGTAGIEDVVNDDDVLTGDVDVQVFEEPEFFGLCVWASVTGDGDKADFHANGELSNQVGQEDDRTGENGYQGYFPDAVFFIGLGDLGGQFADSLGDLVLGIQDFVDISLHRDEIIAVFLVVVLP